MLASVNLTDECFPVLFLSPSILLMLWGVRFVLAYQAPRCSGWALVRSEESWFLVPALPLTSSHLSEAWNPRILKLEGNLEEIWSNPLVSRWRNWNIEKLSALPKVIPHPCRCCPSVPWFWSMQSRQFRVDGPELFFHPLISEVCFYLVHELYYLTFYRDSTWPSSMSKTKQITTVFPI